MAQKEKELEFNKLILENFKIFKGQHTFDFSNLNLYTGANNSGKSTILKAINLFSEGLKKGDFPAVDLLNLNNKYGGGYHNLVNRDSGKDYFRIGFETKIANIPAPFKVMYSFKSGIEDDFSYNKLDHVVFSDLEIIDENREVLFALYNREYFEVTADNIEYEIEKDFASEEEKAAYLKSHVAYPYKSAFDGADEGLILFKFDIKLLKKFIKYITDEDFSLLIKRLHKISHKNYWWGECFSEADYYLINYATEELRFKDLMVDFSEDRHCFLSGYELGQDVCFGEANEADQKYLEILSETRYEDFVKKVLLPIFQSVSSKLELFNQNNTVHIGFQTFEEGLFRPHSQFAYLSKIFQNQLQNDYFDFVHNSLKIFGIDGVVELKPHLDVAFEINLITGVEAIIKKDLEDRIKKDKEEAKKLKEKIEKGIDPEQNKMLLSLMDSPLRRMTYYTLKKFNDNPRINLAEFGKGTASLIGMILKISSVLTSFGTDRRKSKLPRAEYETPEQVHQKIILIEEPETFLHPDWQSKLADFFVYVMKEHGEKNNIKFVIETHSVYLIQKLQLLVARNEFDPSKVNIVYFNTGNEKDRFYRLVMRKDGILKERFGKGFYDETATLTAEILKEQTLN